MELLTKKCIEYIQPLVNRLLIEIQINHIKKGALHGVIGAETCILPSHLRFEMRLGVQLGKYVYWGYGTLGYTEGERRFDGVITSC